MSDIADRLAKLTPEQRAAVQMRLRAMQTGGAKRERIGPRRDSSTYELSFGQQRLWFIEQVGASGAANHIVAAIRLEGALRLDALERSVTGIVARHEILRSRYVNEGGRPVMSVSPASAVPLVVMEAQGDSDDRRLEEARRLTAQEAERPFDLSAAPLLRALLVRVGEHDYVLVLVAHHIVADGWSLGVLTRELGDLYDASSFDRPSPLTPLAIQYADFSAWQREQAGGPGLRAQCSWWCEKLSGLPALEVPTDRPRPPVPSMAGARAARTIDADVTRAVIALSQRQGVTLFVTMLAAFQTLLMRWCGQTDLAVGSPTAGRNWTEVEGLVGLFVNQLVLRTDLGGNPRFTELIARVRDVVTGALAHQDVPFERVVEELGIDRSFSQAPLTPVIFSLQNLPVALPSLTGIRVAPFDFERRVSRFDLSLFATEAAGALHLSLEYRVDLFDAETAQQLLDRFERLLTAIAKDPEQRLAGLPLLPDDQRRLLLVTWNETARAHERGRLVPALVSRHAESTPDAVAVVWGGQHLTYGELDRRARRVACFLVRHGIGPETVVGLCCDRGIPFVVAALGVLESGGAYAPIDPRTPPARRGLALRQTAARLLLVDDVGNAATDGWSGVVAEIGQVLAADQPSSSLMRPVGADNLAYVIHTSGSTGTPKGVAVSHGNLLNLVRWHQRRYGITSADATAQVASVGFDACVWEIWPCLAAGATLHIPDSATKDAPEKLWLWAAQQRITSMFLPTPLAEIALQVTLPRNMAVRSLLTGGDRLHRLPAVPLPFAFVNHYGPTENTVVATAGAVEPLADRSPSIGRPIDNTRVYVLDAAGEPVPVGVTGELYIGGDGLARGYVSAPRLTADRFVPDSLSGIAGARLYRSGDLVRYLRNGSLEFVGRIDQQVKIRGYRIELGEIEAALQRHPGVSAAVAAVVNTGGDRGAVLVAYVVSATQAGPSVDELRTFVRDVLPDYMVPAAVVPLASLPMTTNGKVDRAALPRPALAPAADREVVAPRNEVEETIAAACRDLLRIEQISMLDNFFDLGGHSLVATQLASRLQREFGLEVGLRSIFEAVTLADLAADLLERLLAEA